MLELDGSEHSGSGTLLRYAMVVATLIGEPIHMTRIRAKRDKPGLRPQHLQAVRACCQMSGGRLEGDEINSQEITYRPGKRLTGGAFQWDIGTAGSTTMLAFTLLPLALFCPTACHFSITGGVFQDYAPTGFHTQKLLLPLLAQMGLRATLQILQPGYFPQGQGHLKLSVSPMNKALSSVQLVKVGNVQTIRGLSLASHLRSERVSERMAERSQKLLARAGFPSQIELLHDTTAVQKGAALLLWAETDTGNLLGSDQAGKRGRTSEAIADHVVHSLLEDLRSQATVDRYLADQLILFAALANGSTEYIIPRMTDHVEANLWLVHRMLGVKHVLIDHHLQIDGIGFGPSKG